MGVGVGVGVGVTVVIVIMRMAGAMRPIMLDGVIVWKCVFR
ncbi:hypothetical protein [Cupriavidus alkaliphilus]|uniref:Trimethylamine:corrinoid methyltransferase-like protein n=1 Tax=Cupriavidus alkaliphilus TaxID=942866 RepID=A0A7W4V9U6_9BURK|nr:hypothetical protein [Cupriavidus alkaliphilus]MBB3007706.1 trimethylamine:corrinoid methyltransferase-like protein [Cupriavidus alkaliphilus]